MNVIITVWYRVKPGLREQCMELAKKNVEQTRKEEGNIVYAHYPSMENDQDMFVIEVWENREAVERHIRAPHYLEFSKARKPLLEEGSYKYVLYIGQANEEGNGIVTWSDHVTIHKKEEE